jgi:hypothetical protein
LLTIEGFFRILNAADRNGLADADEFHLAAAKSLASFYGTDCETIWQCGRLRFGHFATSC